MKVYIIEVAKDTYLTDTWSGLDSTDKLKNAKRFEKIVHVKHFGGHFPNLYRCLVNGTFKVRRYNVPDEFEIVDIKEITDANFSN